MDTAKNKTSRRSSKVLMPELERAPETTENISSSSQQNANQDSGSQSSESRPRQTLDTFGSSPSSAGSSPLFSTSSSDEEFEQVAGELGADATDATDALPSSPSKLIEFPVLDREDIEDALRVGHSAAVAKGWGEHWKLQDWQAAVMVPAWDKYLQKLQGTAETYLGDFITRFAGEHKELCALLMVMVLVYAPNVRKTMKLKAEAAGVAIAGSTTASAASSVTSASQA